MYKPEKQDKKPDILIQQSQNIPRGVKNAR